MVLNIDVKLISFNSAAPVVKTIIDLKSAKDELKDNYKSFLLFVTETQQAVFEKFNGGKDIYVPYQIINKKMVMPRFMFQHISDYFASIGVQHQVNHKSHISLKRHMELFGCKFGKLKIDIFADKVLVIDKIIETLRSRHGLIVKLDTGKGKSIIINEIIRRLGMRAHIVTKDKTLQKQMCDEMHNAFHLDESEDCCDCINKSGGSYCRHIALLGGTKTKSNTDLLESGNYKVLVSVINSARIKPAEFWKPFGITFFDECQTYTADKFSEIFQTCQTHYMIGLSATPDEKWNSVMLEHNIGKTIDFDPYIESNGTVNGKVYKIIYNGAPEYTRRMTNTKGIVSVAKMVKQFMSDPERNELLIKIIVDAVTKHKYGFVFAMRNDFLYLLKELLDKRCAELGITINSVVMCADSTNEEREMAYKSANVVFTNYAFGTGVNIVHARFEVHASPYKKGGKQITGRVLRKDFSEERFFYDIIDNRTQLREQFASRELIYNKRGLTIEDYPI